MTTQSSPSPDSNGAGAPGAANGAAQKPRRNRRRRKLILPGIQLKLIAHFFVVAVMCLLLQFLLINRALTTAAANAPGIADYMIERLAPEVLSVFFVSFSVLLPLMLAVGISATFRISGPIYRLTQYLTQVVNGEAPPDCRLREGDHLHDLCELVNRATKMQREASASAAAAAQGTAAADDEEPERDAA